MVYWFLNRDRGPSAARRQLGNGGINHRFNHADKTQRPRIAAVEYFRNPRRRRRTFYINITQPSCSRAGARSRCSQIIANRRIRFSLMGLLRARRHRHVLASHTQFLMPWNSRLYTAHNSALQLRHRSLDQFCSGILTVAGRLLPAWAACLILKPVNAIRSDINGER